MYNEDIKVAFVRQLTNSIAMANVCRYVFDTTEEYEERLGKDLYAFTSDEAKQIIDSIASHRHRSKYHRLSVIRSYIKWCNRSGFIGVNTGILDLSPDGTNKIKERMFSNPIHLQMVLDYMCAPEEYETKDNMIRAYCWLIYSGVAERDAITITVGDVDLKSMTIKYGNKRLEIYRQALPAIENCINLDRIAHYPDKDISKRAYINRCEGQELVRGIYKTPTTMSMRNDLYSRSRVRPMGIGGYAQSDISSQRIWLSGVFYRMYQNEIAGIKPDFHRLAEEKIENGTYSSNNSRMASMSMILRSYEEDYAAWKYAFSL